MLYINQLELASIPYPTDSKHPDSGNYTEGTIATSGCGICSACMMIDRLCTVPLSVEECRDLAMTCGANIDPGTDMTVLGPVLAEKFDLRLLMSDSTEDLIYYLARGGCAILNPGGDRDGYHGLFTAGGHFIVAVSYRNGEFLILDPSMEEDKFDTEERKGRVRTEGNLIYASPAAIEGDTENRRPRYYIFTRKSDIAPMSDAIRAELIANGQESEANRVY